MTPPELLVQSYLRSGKTLHDLHAEHGVKSHVQNQKISLSYDQIEARESDPLSQQCRGLILREGTFDVVAAPMFRFFNLEQTGVSASVNWAEAAFEEKMDGTLIIVYYDDVANRWFCATRSRPEADVPVDNGTKTFTDLVNIAVNRTFGLTDFREWIDTAIYEMQSAMFSRKTLCMELCSPLNRIVCDYPDFSLTMLAVRDNDSLLEEDPAPYALSLRIPCAKTYRFSNIAELIEAVKQWDPKNHEGVVVKDKEFRRIKVKNPSYVAFNHMRDSLSTSVRGCMEVILLGKDDDVIQMVPEFIGDRIKRLKPLVGQVLQRTQQDFNELKEIDVMKDFALAAQQKLWPAALFALKRGKTSDLLLFAQGNNEEVAKIPVNSIDTMLSLCEKLDPSIKDI